MRRPLLWLCVWVVALSSLTAIIPATEAHADFFNRGEHRGYFYNKYDAWGGQVWNSGIHLNLNGNGRQDVDQFMRYVEAKYTGGGKDRIGAAFIYNTMVGNAAPGTGTSVSNGEWDELHNRLYAFVDSGGTLTRRAGYPYRVNTFYQDSAGDIAWYGERGAMPAYVFARGGTEYYVIKEICANPLGGIGIPQSGWTMAGRVTASRTTVSPGQNVTFNYSLRNAGSTKLDKDINWAAHVTTPGGSIGALVNRGVLTERLGANSNWRQVTTENYTIPANASNGQQFCRFIAYAPQSNANGMTGRSPIVCVVVRVMPGATATSDYMGGSFINVDETGTWLHTLNARGFPASEHGTISRVEYDSFQRLGSAVTQLGSGGFGISGSGGTGTFNTSYTGRVQDVGLDVCHYFNYRIWVQQWHTAYTYGTDADGNTIVTGSYRVRDPDVIGSSGSSQGSTSPGRDQCVKVAKKPTVQVWGNDLRVGSGFSNPTSSGAGSGVTTPQFTASGLLKGSWAEYSIIAPTRSPAGRQSVFRIASGSGYVAPISVGGSAALWNRLTFSNTSPTNAGNYTAYNQMGNAPDVLSYFTSGHISPRLTLVNPAPGNVSSYQPNTVLVASGVVDITGNIQNDSSAANPRGITQMVIIAKGGFKIHENVTRVDAWLITPGGTINTCPNAGGQLTTNDCPALLQINGPIMAGDLEMKRTGGVMTGAPAELFNLRGDAYVWARGMSEDAGVWHTVNLRELPPRY